MYFLPNKPGALQGLMLMEKTQLTQEPKVISRYHKQIKFSIKYLELCYRLTNNFYRALVISMRFVVSSVKPSQRFIMHNIGHSYEFPLDSIYGVNIPKQFVTCAIFLVSIGWTFRSISGPERYQE